MRCAANTAMTASDEARLRFELTAAQPKLGEAVELFRRLLQSGHATRARNDRPQVDKRISDLAKKRQP